MAESRVVRLGWGHSRVGVMNATDTRPFLETVNLQDIDRDDELFSINFEPDLGRLKTSVEQIGMVAPIWLRRKRRGFQIINGFRRFDVARMVGETHLQALIWEEEILDDRSAFEMGLHENALTRPLNIAEKALVLDKLLGPFSVPRDEAVRVYLPLMGLEPHESVLNTVLVINTFSPDVKRYAVSRRLSLANMGLLAMFSPREREALCQFLSPLRVGENVLKEILTFTREICRRDRMEIEGLISDQRISKVFSDSRLSGPQKIQTLRSLLRTKRYPRFSGLEERFMRWRKGITVSPQVTISPPPFFEGDRFKVAFSFKNREDYQAIVEDLRSLSQGPIPELLTIKGYGTDGH